MTSHLRCCLIHIRRSTFVDNQSVIDCHRLPLNTYSRVTKVSFRASSQRQHALSSYGMFLRFNAWAECALKKFTGNKARVSHQNHREIAWVLVKQRTQVSTEQNDLPFWGLDFARLSEFDQIKLDVKSKTLWSVAFRVWNPFLKLKKLLFLKLNSIICFQNSSLLQRKWWFDSTTAIVYDIRSIFWPVAPHKISHGAICWCPGCVIPSPLCEWLSH